MSDWLARYYGKEAKTLNPTIIFEGKSKAIVRLCRSRIADRTSSNVGYVLIDKNGSHSTSVHKSVLEGMPSRMADFDKMKKLLAEEDSK